MTNNIPYLQLTNIHLDRLGKKVLKDFNLTIAKNENWIVLGPNGSGKSSLISLLQGYLWPQKGEVSVLGQKFGEDDITEIRHVIGWVGSELETKFSPKEKGRNILLSGTVGTLGLKFDIPNKEQIKKVNQLIRLMQLEKFVDKPFNNISQGQRRLIAIARALLTNPRLFLLDEACAGLDPVAREEFLNRLEHLGNLLESPSMISATHHVEEIRPPFTHCLLIKDGSVFKAGKIADVVNSKNISELFGRPIQMIKSKGRYQLKIK